MVLVVITLWGASVLEEKSFSAMARRRVQIEVDVVLPANPNLHRTNHDARRLRRKFRQGITGDPIGDFDTAADAEHLEFGLAQIDGPAASGSGRARSCATECLQTGGKILRKAH